MKFVQYVNCVSPHQLPLAREIAKRVGEDQFLYVYVERVLSNRMAMGWTDARDSWIVEANDRSQVFLENCETLFTGIRDVALFRRRAVHGLLTYYYSERWFKPIYGFPGWLRLLYPKYFCLAYRFVRWLSIDSDARYFAVGPWAARDFRLLFRIFSPLNYRQLDEKIVPWGYFVAPSVQKAGFRYHSRIPDSNFPLRVLWVGRLLRWKRVDTIVNAIRLVPNATLTVVGDGPAASKLHKLARGVRIVFLKSQPISEIRKLMHEHDVYVLSSNQEEGWGAVVNEALEEGMIVLGTKEAGSSSAMLPLCCQFPAGSVESLVRLLMRVRRGDFVPLGIGGWSPDAAAERLLKLKRC